MSNNKKYNEVLSSWDIHHSNIYSTRITELEIAGNWDKIKLIIDKFEKVILSGKVFSRNKVDIENLKLEALSGYTSKYELKFPGGKNNLRLIYSYTKDVKIEKGVKYINNKILFENIGTHSQVGTSASDNSSKEPLYINGFVNLDHPHWKAKANRATKETIRRFKAGIPPDERYTTVEYVKVK